MSPRYQLTPIAQSDVDRIIDFIAEDSVDAALRVHDALEEAFRHLAEMPAMGHTREDLTERPVKFWSVYSYRCLHLIAAMSDSALRKRRSCRSRFAGFCRRLRPIAVSKGQEKGNARRPTCRVIV